MFGTNAAAYRTNGSTGIARLPDLFTAGQWKALADALGLSDRQVEIARLICRGLKNHELADVLGIAPDTVRKHRKALFGKLEVSDRVGVPVRLIMAQRALRGKRRR